MRAISILLAVFLCTVCTLSATASGDRLTIAHETYTLDNGLTVILSEDHDIPVVRVEIWVDVGSKDEGSDQHGYAHLVEHLMFEGSQRSDTDYHAPLEAVGARPGGRTNRDTTRYHEQLPAEYLPLALWMEADRLGWPVMTEDKLNTQRDVIASERRERYQDVDYGEAWSLAFQNAFPDGHPYHHATIAEEADLASTTVAQIQAFTETWYGPGNATLSVVGDFDPAEAKELIERMFGSIPAGAAPSPPEIPKAKLKKQVVVKIERDVPQAKVWIVWPTPPALTHEDAELDLLAEVLVNRQRAPLSQKLGRMDLVQRVSASQKSYRLGSVFAIELQVAEGVETDRVVNTVDKVLKEIAFVPMPDPHVDEARAQYERRRTEDLATLAGRSYRLQFYNQVVGEPDHVAADLERYDDIDGADLQAALRKHLPLNKRVVIHIAPPPTPEDEEGKED